jgi:hypothetical protein
MVPSTTALLPRGRLILYKGKGHMAMTARRPAREVLMFLAPGFRLGLARCDLLIRKSAFDLEG